MTSVAPSGSIQRRLLSLLLGAVTLTWLAATVATYIDAHREADRLLDAHLAQSASVLAAQAGHELMELDTDDLAEMGEYAQAVTFQVWENGTRLVVRSATAPGVRLSGVEQGFADSEVAGQKWRVFTLWDRDHEALIEVAEDHAIRNAIAARVAFNALVPLAVALPVLALLIGWSVRRALRPLALLGEAVRTRQPMALEPLDLRGVPTEATALVRRLNELFDRIRRSTELERRFTADASHELRKPVAAARAQAEVARTTRDAGLRDGALDNVVRACDRMGGLIEQLLTLARLEQDQAPELPDLDLAAIVRRGIAELASRALARGEADIELETHGNTQVRGRGELLETLFRNLLSNALRHGGGAKIRVTVAGTPDGVRLSVADAGPGVAPADLPHLGERFFRGQATGPGSGLGLSIARRIADLHGAQLKFGPGPSGQGLEASVTFCPAAPA